MKNNINASGFKKVAIIGTAGLPANYGGFETLTEHLVENLNNEYDITVYCSGKKYPQKDRKRFYKNARLKYIPLDANGVQSIFYDSWSILHSLFYADVLLILGVAGAWMLPFIKFFTNKKIIISIDGIEWKREKWSKLAKIYLYWAEGLAVKYSHIDISDNEAIQDYTAMKYGSLSRVIEYGADHTLTIPIAEADKKIYPFIKLPYAFNVCRIEPENNVHLILEAFSKMPKYRLVMVGNWENSKYGKELKNEYQKYHNISIVDPIYDQKKLDLLRSNALVYVHGHSAGGTNPSLVEAMYLGLPIVSFDVAYNKVTTEQKALYFKTSEDLKYLIENTHLEIFRSIGAKMSAIAERRYIWKDIADRYKALITEAVQTSKKTSISSSVSDLDYSELLELGVSHLKFADKFYAQR